MYCENCGKWSGKYPLCKDCYYEDGFLEEDLPKWLKNNDSENNVCIICGDDTNNDYLFCRNCYYKYRNKTIILKVRNCNDFELVNEYYDAKYKCIDGHFVKSKSEREIDNFLFRNKIRHCYEPSLSINGDEQNDIHPDFYLPDLNAYIEHWGKEGDENYDEQKEYKLKIYKRLGITLICTHENSDAKDFESALIRKLNNFVKGKINFN